MIHTIIKERLLHIYHENNCGYKHRIISDYRINRQSHVFILFMPVFKRTLPFLIKCNAANNDDDDNH